ncbi:hypothetical protein J6590_095996, partial [Homalodisca vitripennis]
FTTGVHRPMPSLRMDSVQIVISVAEEMYLENQANKKELVFLIVVGHNSITKNIEVADPARSELAIRQIS